MIIRCECSWSVDSRTFLFSFLHDETIFSFKVATDATLRRVNKSKLESAWLNVNELGKLQCTGLASSMEILKIRLMSFSLLHSRFSAKFRGIEVGRGRMFRLFKDSRFQRIQLEKMFHYENSGLEIVSQREFSFSFVRTSRILCSGRN